MSNIQKKKWSKDRIRQEIRRLDSKTGLSGEKITVKLYTATEPIGYFTFIDPVRMTFGFSSTRFEAPGFTDTEALDIIRHEYAHYMEYQLYGESSDHGPNWKKCCIQIGAQTHQYYTDAWRDEVRDRERERTRKNRVDGYTVGKKVNHPVFGIGIIEKIDRFPTMTILCVRFGEMLKSLDIEWVRNNCNK